MVSAGITGTIAIIAGPAPVFYALATQKSSRQEPQTKGAYFFLIFILAPKDWFLLDMVINQPNQFTTIKTPAKLLAGACEIKYIKRLEDIASKSL